MRTIISGPVDDRVIESASLLGDITPTSYVTNGLWSPPASDLPVSVYPVDPKLATVGEIARDYYLVQHADAAIIVGGNRHLSDLAEQYGLAVYEE